MLQFRKLLSAYDVQQVCIEHNYYTRGTSAEYDAMFKKLETANHTQKTEDYEKVMQDILDHSDTEDTLLDVCGFVCYRMKIFPTT